MFRNKITAFFLVLFTMLALATSVLAMSEENRKNFMKMSEQERKFLLMYFDEDELFVVSATRSLKSISRVAENVEVVTAADIELMNAHTVAEVLISVTGVQVQFAGSSPGFLNAALIQGSEARQVAVFMDGVPQPWLSSQIADIGFIPVQMIERIEIIKGPASSAWGSSLGGVINIITKSPVRKAGHNGMISASYGERETGDFRAEATGRKDRFGYYLYAGILRSDGQLPFTGVDNNYFYSKLTFDITKDTELLFTLFHGKAERERGGSVASDWQDEDSPEQFQSTLSLKTALSNDLDLNLTARAFKKNADFDESTVSKGEELYFEREKNTKIGAGAHLVWRQANHVLTMGADYDKFKLELTSMNGEGNQNKYAAYVNDSITMGKVNITPGIRYDKSDIIGDFISPSLGATYNLTETVLLRAYVARGFTEPSLFLIDGSFNTVSLFVPNPDLKSEEVWSYQVGVETTALKYLWLKLSAFRHDVTDALIPVDVDSSIGSWTYVNKQSVRREGVEVEIRTKPVYHFTLLAGGAVMHQEDRDTGEEIKGVPKTTFNASLKYDDEMSLRALLTGRYIDWNSPADYNAKKAMIFDFNLIKKLISYKERTVEVFFSAHNIFNGAQYWYDGYPNTRRWVEAGLRARF